MAEFAMHIIRSSLAYQTVKCPKTGGNTSFGVGRDSLLFGQVRRTCASHNERTTGKNGWGCNYRQCMLRTPFAGAKRLPHREISCTLFAFPGAAMRAG